MKITAIEIKPGMIIEHKNDYWNVLKTQHVKPGKGGAFNQVELKSVIKGTKLNERFRSSETVEKAEVDEKKFNFLYIDGENCHFMDNETFDQIEIDSTILGSVSDWLDGEEECKILFWNDSVLRVEPPTFVFKEIIDTEPGLKGDTVSNTLKPAKIESGKEIQVPIFINIGDTIKIDTRDGSYVSRNNE